MTLFSIKWHRKGRRPSWSWLDTYLRIVIKITKRMSVCPGSRPRIESNASWIISNGSVCRDLLTAVLIDGASKHSNISLIFALACQNVFKGTSCFGTHVKFSIRHMQNLTPSSETQMKWHSYKGDSMSLKELPLLWYSRKVFATCRT
jgi:hypothetical protein